MSTKPNGGPAYPARDFWDEAESRKHEPGMTLRDWFAGQALAGLCSNPALNEVTEDLKLTPKQVQEAFSRSAYHQADAMISERDK